MARDGTIWRAAIVVAGVLSIGAMSYGQAGRPPRNGAPPQPRSNGGGGDRERGLPVKPVIEADLGALDDEIAQYLQFRGEVGPNEAARLELLIDLRVVARWCFAAAMNAQSESELQVNAYFRGQEALATARAMAEHFKNAAAPDAAANAAMTKVHALTFNLQDLKSGKQADDLFHDLSGPLATAAGPLPADVKQIPLMRPPTPKGETRPVTQAPKVEIDPVSRAKLLTVSQGLKKQVIALAEASNTARADLASTDEKKKDAATALVAMTHRVLDMAEGLSQNAAIDPQSRPKLEQQLADGVALYTDPRMRNVGKQRISTLEFYAQTVSRLRKLNLKPEIQQKLAPIFAYAADHSDQGPKLMSAVESYLQACARADAHPVVNGLPARESKAVADSLKLLAAEREAFLTDAAAIPRMVSADPANFLRHVEAMNRALDSADLFERIPKAQQLLTTSYKPRPSGGLERRIVAAWTTLGDAKATTTARDDATRFLAELAKLYDHATAIDAAAAVPPEIAKVYAHNKLAAFDTKRREALTDALSVLASGKDLDTGRSLKLDQMKMLRAALAEVPMLEQAISKDAILDRWADWPVDPADCQAIFTPYRENMAMLFEFYATNDAPPPMQWGPTQARYGPLIKLMERVGTQAEFCALLPAGWPGNIGRLATPLNEQPYGQERYAAFCMKLWARYQTAGDQTSAITVADTLASRLKR
jgi:hypothetical protein